MATHPRSAILLMVVVCSTTTSAFLFPTAPASASTRLASSYYDDMDYTAQRNQVQEKYVQVLERKERVC
jgi:hypothetical protein